MQVSRSLTVRGSERRPAGYDKESAGQWVNVSLERKRGGEGGEQGPCSLVTVFIMILKAMIESDMRFKVIILIIVWRKE